MRMRVIILVKKTPRACPGDELTVAVKDGDNLLKESFKYFDILFTEI